MALLHIVIAFLWGNMPSTMFAVDATLLLGWTSVRQNISALLNSSDPSFQHSCTRQLSLGCVGQDVFFCDAAARVFNIFCCHYLLCCSHSWYTGVHACSCPNIRKCAAAGFYFHLPTLNPQLLPAPYIQCLDQNLLQIKSK